MSQASRRTHLRPVKSGLVGQTAVVEGAGVGQVDPIAIDLRAVAGDDLDEPERERPAQSIRTSTGSPGLKTTLDPLGCPLTVNSGMRTSPVVTKNRPPRRLSSTGCQPSSNRGTRSGSRRCS